LGVTAGVSGRGLVEQLPNRIRQRDPDPQAFEDFAAVFGPVFRRHALQAGFAPFEATDFALNLAMDIPIRVLEGKFEAREDASFSAWVMAVMRRALSDEWRKKKRSPHVVPLQQETIPRHGFDSGGEAVDTEVVLAVREAVRALPERAREMIELRHLQGEEDFAGIAARLGIRPGTARVRHSRAMALLAEALTDHPALRKVLERAKARS
jgi:RNA polymerase sigma factor (sigma-70 family)